MCAYNPTNKLYSRIWTWDLLKNAEMRYADAHGKKKEMYDWENI